MKKSFFIISFLVYSLVLAGSTSRPVATKTLPYIECSEYKSDFGFQGQCIYKTKQSDWEISYNRAGSEKRSLKNKLKNLIVLFHPDTNSSKIQEWWAPLVGSKKAIDTDEWVVLSVGYIGDGRPKLGSPELLDTQVLFDSTLALIEFVYPNEEYIVGGASRGGIFALLFSKMFPDRCKKVFSVAGHILKTPSDETLVSEMTSNLLMAQMENGTYSDWSIEKKNNFWLKATRERITNYYSNEYFKDASKAMDLGLKVEDYPGEKKFIEMTRQGWVDWFSKQVDPVWWLSQLNQLIGGYSQFERYKKVTAPVLLISFDKDQVFPTAEFKESYDLLKKNNSKVRWVELKDIRGHMACCSNEPSPELVGTLSQFLNH